jgi:ornithine cyclodeaminase/alanine dehydrogenase-like protein (mu-crystallin family)
MKFFDEPQVRAVLTYQDLIPAMRQALMDFSAGRAIQPVRSVLPVAAHAGWFCGHASGIRHRGFLT